MNRSLMRASSHELADFEFVGLEIYEESVLDPSGFQVTETLRLMLRG